MDIYSRKLIIIIILNFYFKYLVCATSCIRKEDVKYVSERNERVDHTVIVQAIKVE